MSDEIKLPKPSEMVEVALKGSAALLGGLYATGLIVASLRLAQLGVLSTEFVKPLYILTGVWAWLPFAIAIATWLTYRETLKGSGGRRSSSRVLGTKMPRVRAGFWSLMVGAGLLYTFCYVLPMNANLFLHQIGFGEDFGGCFLLLMIVPLTIVFLIKPHTGETGETRIASALRLAIPILFLGVSYLMGFTFLVYVQIPVQLGGGGPRTFALVITQPEIRQAITGDIEAKSPIIRPVVAETAANYVLHAPNVKGLEHSFVILPKQAVSVATVIGSAAEPKDYKEIQNRTGDRDKMNSLGSPSVTPKR